MPPAVMNTSSVRLQDPILSTHAQGYRNAQAVGHLLFPRVPVGQSGGQVIEFGKEAFRKYNARRAPGSATQRIQFGYAGKPFALVQDALDAVVPREWQRDASQVPGIDLAKRAVNMTFSVISNLLEMEQARIATHMGNYDANHHLLLAGNEKWSADGGKPLKNISDGKEAVRATTGMEPNTLVLSPKAWKGAKENPSVLERFKFTTNSPITLEMFAKLVEVETVVVGKAIMANDDDEFSDIWGNAAILAYVPSSPEGMEQPSYGYTYTMEGHPVVEQPYYDHGSKSWVYGCSMERSPVLTGMTAGFLISQPG